jgi:hypothetical protein
MERAHAELTLAQAELIMGLPPRDWYQRLVRGSNIPGGCYLFSMRLDGGVEVIIIATAHFAEDAALVPLVNALSMKLKDDDPVMQIGLTGPYRMRLALDNPDPYYNRPCPCLCDLDSIRTKKAFIRSIVEEWEESEEGGKERKQ